MPSGNIWDYQQKIGRIDRRRSNHGWTRRVVFEGLQGYANVAAIQAIIPPDSAVFPGEGGQLAAILVNSTI